VSGKVGNVWDGWRIFKCMNLCSFLALSEGVGLSLVILDLGLQGLLSLREYGGGRPFFYPD
jgi:hypothetical protein